MGVPMRLIITLHRWALIDLELRLMQNIGDEEEAVGDPHDEDPESKAHPFGFGL